MIPGGCGDFNFPPNFRPQHLEYAVEKGVHCFQKPVAVDAPGVRKVIDLAKKAKEKNLGFMSVSAGGIITQNKKSSSESKMGGIGEVNAMYSTYNGGEVWKKKGKMDGAIWKPK